MTETATRLRTQTTNPEGDPRLLVVFGVGNKLAAPDETWFVDQLVAAGYRVTAVELPLDIEEVETDYAGPVQRIHDEEDPDAVVGHSLGGLVTATLETEAREVYLSPWWGFYEGKVSALERWLVPELPFSLPILPTKTTREEIGAELSDDDWTNVPQYISPTFITAVDEAQQDLPVIGDDAVVFTTLSDTIISHPAIGAAVSATQVRLYDGGHQLFSSAGRDDLVDDLIEELP